MNTTVTATGMKVQAKAEKGLLINEVNEIQTSTDVATSWDDKATANQGTGSLLYPSSTKDGLTWYHAASKKSSDAAARDSTGLNPNLVGGSYTSFSAASLAEISSFTNKSAAAGSNAAYQTMGEANAEAGYYVMYTYYLKSSAEEIPLGQGTSTKQYVAVSRVQATLPGTQQSKDLNKALRVGVKMQDGSNFYVFAPVSGATLTYYVGGASQSITATDTSDTFTPVNTDLTKLPAKTDTNGGKAAYIYIWYEGEDANCKSDNVTANLDNISIDVDFQLVTVA